VSNLKINYAKVNLVLYIFVIAVFDLLRTVIEILHIPFRYYFGGNPPLLLPLLLLMLVLNLWRIDKRYNRVIPINLTDILMIITIYGWVLLYFYHSDYLGGWRKSWDGAYLITSNLWLFLSLFILKSYSYIIHDLRERLVKVVTNLLTWFAIGFLALFFLDKIVGLPIHDHLQNTNGIALKSAFCILLILFFSFNMRMHTLLIIVSLHVLVAYVSNAKASLIAIALMILYRGYSLIMSRRGRLYTNTFVFAAIATIVALFYNEIYFYLDSVASSFDIFGEAYEAAEGYNMENSTVSALSRIQSNLLVLAEFFKNPLVGIGYQQVAAIQSFGYMSHTYYLFPLTAYGVLGVMPYVIMLTRIFFRGLRLNYEETIATALFVTTAFTFLNDMVAWMAIIFFIVQTRPSYRIADSMLMKG
jgi:hypothetical protein